jgi:hypothetical protein
MNYAEREAFFSYLDADYPGVLADLQKISIQSEIELDRFHAEKILDRLWDRKVREKILSLPVSDRLSEILHEYPHGWIHTRTQEVIRLLNSMPDRKGTLFMIGRSNLPLSALGFHLATGCQVVWFDPYDDSIKPANNFIKELEIFGLLKAGSITMRALDEKNSDLFDRDGLAVMILDDDLMRPEIFHQSSCAALPLITVDALGMARLLYPYSPERRPEQTLYKRQAVILAQNASDEPTHNIVSYASRASDMFLSLSLFR